MESNGKYDFKELYYTLLHEYDEFKEIYRKLSCEYLKIENNCKSKGEEM